MLTIHHLQVSQSERIIWLCEELQIPYELKLYKRDPLYSPASLKALSPLGTAPVITDGPLTLAESGAIVEYIIQKHGNGRLALPPTHTNYADYLYWLHFSNANLQAIVSRNMLLRAAQVPTNNPIMKGTTAKLENVLGLLESRLAQATWLAGDEFTAADVMSVFSLTTMRTFMPFDLSRYPNILGYLKRVGERKAYQDAMAKGDPEFDPILSGPAPELFEGMKL
jgi:glutathione S-transferase